MNFLFPGYLLGLGLVALPIIIHFFNFQRAKKVYFTNVEFLRTVKEVTNSRNKLRNLLILLARVLFISFLVIAFARPIIPNKEANSMGSSNFVSVYFDNSYSMQNERDNRRLFDMGKNYVEKLTELYPKNGLYQLIDNSSAGNMSFFYEKDRLLEKLSELNFSNTGQKLENIYSRQQEALVNNSAYRSNHIFWISDFQKNSIGDLSQLALDSSNHIYLLPVQPEAKTNVFIDSLWLETPFVKVQENSLVNVRVMNSGETETNDILLKLFIDDKQVASSTLDIPAGSSQEVQLNFAVADGGDKKCRVTIEDYPVTFDNDYYFILKVAPKIKIVAIRGQGKDYITPVYSNESFFEIQSFGIDAVDYNALTSVDLIVLQNLNDIDGALQAALNKALQQGSTLVVFPGARSNMASYNAALPLRMEWLGQKTDSVAFTGIQVPSDQNPFFEGVFERVSQNMSMPQGLPLLRWSSVSENLLKYKTGLPFLGQVQTSSQAEVFVFSTPLALQFTDFPKHALFVPTMYKIALASKVKSERLAFSFNESVATLSMDSISRNDIFKLVEGSFELIPSQRVIQSQLMINIPKAELEANTYDLVLTKSNEKKGKVAFNYDHQESDLDHYSIDELKELFAHKKNVQVFDGIEADDLVTEFKEKNIATFLWRHFLVMALLFLLMEVLIIRFWKS
ncbi:BatA domain-containing protein [Rapidithrix thailandica]|uniref:BatA domain-containing protein n=1 Tax=Rapidithrix thailandica TaxID=413964 RepID=A0AAW9RUS0_9BACT